MTATDNLKTYMAWYAEKAGGRWARLWGGKDYKAKAEKLATVIKMIDALPERMQKVAVDGIALFTARIRSETQGGEKTTLKEFDDLIAFVSNLIDNMKQ
jgi:hypothetical protein